MLLWVDLETTGLDSDKDTILEVAAIVTDDKFNEVARFHRVTNEASKWKFEDLHPKVRAMHTTNGLWMESANLTPNYPYRYVENTLDQIDHDLAEIVINTCFGGRIDWSVTEDEVKKKKMPVLAGSTVSFDRQFMNRLLPRSAAPLSHRHLDVSTLNEMAKRFWPAVYEGRPRTDNPMHRAVADIEASIRVAKYYTEALGPSVMPGPR